LGAPNLRRGECQGAGTRDKQLWDGIGREKLVAKKWTKTSLDF